MEIGAQESTDTEQKQETEKQERERERDREREREREGCCLAGASECSAGFLLVCCSAREQPLSKKREPHQWQSFFANKPGGSANRAARRGAGTRRGPKVGVSSVQGQLRGFSRRSTGPRLEHARVTTDRQTSARLRAGGVRLLLG